MIQALNKESICHKNIDEPSCIDLFLTNSLKCSGDCLTLETGLLYLHKLFVTVIKMKHERSPPKIIKYRDYKNFNINVFTNRLQRTLKHYFF